MQRAPEVGQAGNRAERAERAERLAVFVWLAWYAKPGAQGGGADPSYAALGHAAGGLSARTVARRLAALERDGFIRRQPSPRRGARVCWQVVLPEDLGTPWSADPPSAPQGVPTPSAPQGVPTLKAKRLKRGSPYPFMSGQSEAPAFPVPPAPAGRQPRAPRPRRGQVTTSARQRPAPPCPAAGLEPAALAVLERRWAPIRARLAAMVRGAGFELYLDRLHLHAVVEPGGLVLGGPEGSVTWIAERYAQILTAACRPARWRLEPCAAVSAAVPGGGSDGWST